MRNRKRDLETPEDLSGLAGWMYSDLILGLMVIFLATISFVPQFYGTLIGAPNSANSTGAPTYQYSQYYDEVLVAVYSSADPQKIKSDVEEFLIQNELPINSIIVSAQIVGAYDPVTENSTDAINRALKFSQAIDASDPALFANASSTLSSTQSITTSQVVLRLMFVAEIDVQK
jgi:hypothetical protein